ncbi:mitochondrial glycerol-3-phosphate dehydrogenase [Balamuthia mandrillaris]
MWRKRVLYGGGALLLGSGALYAYNVSTHSVLNTRTTFQRWTHEEQLKGKPGDSDARLRVPTRAEQLERLKAGREFDMLVVGGGATGVGVALDATTRGLKVALVEKDDFGSGTSSRSTKLVHGGVRYLEKAFKELDYDQYALVREALHERANLLKISPHLSYELPIMLPIYKWWQVPYYWAGAKAYDLLAGKQGLESSYFLSKTKALEKFPMLKSDALVGAVVYYDGAHNDARMNVSLALTAAAHGAAIANHIEVVKLIKKTDAKTGELRVAGATVRDTQTGETWNVHAKGVVNATGPFADKLRKMDNKDCEDMVVPSAGVHVILPDYYSPQDMGLLDPSTSDGRVIFFLPWQGSTIAGTTDTKTDVSFLPKPTESEITFILKEVKHYLSPDVQVRRGDVLAAWSGIRPLVRNPKKKGTEGLARSHVVTVSDDGLVTISGGKWTTYRRMAADTVDKAIKVFGLKPKNECRTEYVMLVGGHEFTPTMFIKLIQKYGVDKEVAKHLCESYGDKAGEVLQHATPTGRTWPVMGLRLHPSYPYIFAEIDYAVQKEYACTAVDVLARRMRLAFLNANVAMDMLPVVIDRMAKHLNWSEARKKKEYEEGKTFLKTMGLTYNRLEFNTMDLIAYRDAFAAQDPEGEGYISLLGLKNMLKDLGKPLPDEKLKQFINEKLTDFIAVNGRITFDDVLELMSWVRKDEKAATKPAKEPVASSDVAKIHPTRSGGGV